MADLQSKNADEKCNTIRQIRFIVIIIV
jgi:hypothetical protein